MQAVAATGAEAVPVSAADEPLDPAAAGGGVAGHDGRGKARTRLAHAIDVEQNSELRRASGAGRLMVNSLHHQAVKGLGSGPKVTVSSPDGVVEGVEGGDRIVAVQCHPEELVIERRWALRLLQRFVERAASARQGSC